MTVGPVLGLDEEEKKKSSEMVLGDGGGRRVDDEDEEMGVVKVVDEAWRLGECVRE